MKAASQKMSPEESILAVLSPEERLDAALLVAREAFRDSQLTLKDAETAVRKVRRKRHAARSTRTAGRR
jgi:hypothetical protein